LLIPVSRGSSFEKNPKVIRSHFALTPSRKTPKK
jgi:hypothetical protein